MKRRSTRQHSLRLRSSHRNAGVQHGVALGIYFGFAIILIDQGASLTTNLLGVSSDPAAFTWFLAWWPWAFAHDLNPFFSYQVWQPHGLNLAWTTSIPLLAILGSPVTLSYGPIVTYNLFTIIAPALSAWAAYGLCWYLTGRVGAALIGGYLFGFSPYEMAEALAHLNLDFTCLVPLIVWTSLVRINGQIGRRRAVILLSLLVSLQAYIFIEIVATGLFFAILIWCLAYTMLPPLRKMLSSLIIDGLCIMSISFLLTSPLLGAMLLQQRDVIIPQSWSFFSAAHLLNLIAPSPAIVLSNPAYRNLGRGLLGLLPDTDVTTGLPTLIILIGFFSDCKTIKPARFIFWTLITIDVASLGPGLWFGNTYTGIVLPWRLILQAPLIASALPVRFLMYASLLIAIIVALWVARAPRPATLARLTMGTLACLCLTPAPHPIQAVPGLAVFTPKRLPALLGPNARLLILPDERLNFSPLWQATSRFTFSQTQGYLGYPPQFAMNIPTTYDFMFNMPSTHLARDIVQFCQSTGTNFVILGDGSAPAAVRAMATLSWPARHVADITIYKVPR